jgi:hypothetical protein
LALDGRVEVGKIEETENEDMYAESGDSEGDRN